MHKRTEPRNSIAYRQAGTVAAVAAMLALGPVCAQNAFAFKLFGIKLWGEDETADQVSDPVRYTVDFKSDNLDKDLKDALNDSSMLVSDKDKPVSGDLGVVVKARDDRDRLIATLYERARYGGVVTITVNGTPSMPCRRRRPSAAPSLLRSQSASILAQSSNSARSTCSAMPRGSTRPIMASCVAAMPAR